MEKLRPCGQISYADVARAAERSGRRRLATMLLDLEPLASDQVISLGAYYVFVVISIIQLIVDNGSFKV